MRVGKLQHYLEHIEDALDTFKQVRDEMLIRRYHIILYSYALICLCVSIILISDNTFLNKVLLKSGELRGEMLSDRSKSSRNDSKDTS